MSFRNFIFIQWFLLFLDQVSKYLIYSESLVFSSSLMNLELKRNFGVALGTQLGDPRLINVLLIFLFIFLFLLQIFWIFYLFKGKIFKNLNLFILFMMAGVTGNVLDKFFRGFVVDYINLNFSFFKNLYFNLADLYLLFGSFGVFIFLFTKSSLLYFEANKRVKLVLEEDYQLTTSKFFISIVWAVSFVSFFICGGLMSYFRIPNKNELLLFILSAQVIFSIILSFAAYYLGILFSHRTSGALFALKRELIFNSKEKLQLREDDFHQEYLDEIYSLFKR